MQQSNNSRLAKNTSFLYLRMLFLMLITFFTTRKVLEALGVENLGIYNVVGSLILMFDFVSSGLSNATQRYLNVGIGENNEEKTQQYFSQSLVVHVLLALVIVLFAETVGVWFVKNKLIVPAERISAAITIWHFSIISLFFRFIKICYESDVIAREKMSIYAYLSIVEGVGKLLICYAVISCNSVDKLVLYGGLILALNVIVTLFNVVYCMCNFRESHLKLYTDRKVYKELFSFIGINSFGVISWSLGKHGINVIMNMFFGPVINAAKGLASQLDGVITQFATNINIAVRPQITKLYAQGRLEEMMNLAHKSTKYIYYVSFIVSVPLLFQTEEILSIWLKEVPDYTKLFVQILVFEFWGNVLGSTYNSVSISIGKIKNVQMYGRLITLAGLPISYLVLRLYPNPYLPVLIMVILTFIYSAFIVYDINRHLRFGLSHYMKLVVCPIFKVMGVSFMGCGCFAHFILIENKMLSFFVVSFVLCLFSLLVILYIGLDSGERKKIISLVKNKIIK